MMMMVMNDDNDDDDDDGDDDDDDDDVLTFALFPEVSSLFTKQAERKKRLDGRK